MSATARKQDLPPAGGYKRILFARNPAKTYFSGNVFCSPSHRSISALKIFFKVTK